MTHPITDLTEQELLQLEADEAALSELFAAAADAPSADTLCALEQLAEALPHLEQALETAHAALQALPPEEEPSEAALARLMAFAEATPGRELAAFAAQEEPELRELFDAHQEPLSVAAEARLVAHAQRLAGGAPVVRGRFKRWLAPGFATAAAAALALFMGLSGTSPEAPVGATAAAGAFPTEQVPSATTALAHAGGAEAPLSAEEAQLLASSSSYEEEDYELLSLTGLGAITEDAELEALLGALSSALEEP